MGTCTAFGSPLVPEVKIIMKVSVGLDLAVRHQLAGAAATRSAHSGGGGVEDPDAGEVEPVEQVPVLGVGDQELALDPAYVASRPSPRRVVLIPHST